MEGNGKQPLEQQQRLIEWVMKSCRDRKVIKSLRINWSKDGEAIGYSASYKFLDEFKPKTK